MPETFVLDCSIAMKWVLPEPGRAAALEWFERYASGEINLIAPDIILVEFASAVAKRRRRKDLSPARAREAFLLLVKISPKTYAANALLAQALHLSLSLHLSLCDCSYLALAQERKCSVLTADLRFMRAVQSWFPVRHVF